MPAVPIPRNTPSVRIAVIGGGVIGLSCALELARLGADVRVFDLTPEGMGPTSARAAGMLGLAFEAAEGAADFLALAKRSIDLWPDFASRLAHGGRIDLGYSRTPAIACALNSEEAAKLRLLLAAAHAQGLRGDLLSAAESRKFEPSLSPRTELAALLPDDAQVDADALWRALREAAQPMLAGRMITEIACGERFSIGGEAFERVLLATGAAPIAIRFSDASGACLDPRLPAIEPVKGQMLALSPLPGGPRRVVRSLGEVYIAPKARWTLVGATSEPGRTDTQVNRQSLDRLRAKAAELAPALASAEEAGSWAGVRPATADGLPAIGKTAIADVFAALGHFRNGILLAPVTADLIARQMLGGGVDALAQPFSLARFDKRAEAPHSR